jgi:hypothetical protein
MLAVSYEEDGADIPGPRHSEAAEDVGPHGGECPWRDVSVRPVQDPHAREPPMAGVRVVGGVQVKVWVNGSRKIHPTRKENLFCFLFSIPKSIQIQMQF